MTESDQPVVLARTEGSTRILTLNRPAARNAINLSIREALEAALAEADDDRDIAVIVLTGTDPAFSGGVDLKEMTSPQRQRRLRPNPGDVLRAVNTPLVAAVNGVCVTGGLELALSCDFIIASDRARFADTHAQLGLISGWGLTAMLATAVGVRMAKELSVSGRIIDAAEAARIGLVNHVIPHDELMGYTLELAGRMAGAKPKCARAMIELYDHSLGQGLDAALKAEEFAASIYTAGTGDVAGRSAGVMAANRTEPRPAAQQ